MAASLFERFDHRDVADLIAAYPLAWVTTGGGGPASLLPLLADVAEDGSVVGLIGHLARRNPLATALAGDPFVDILFTGPHGYVGPGMISQPGWAPTWNYAQLRIRAEIILDPDGADAALALLVNRMEESQPDPWRIEDMGPRYLRMRSEIIAFRARIARLEGRFKLGQDEAVGTLREILTSLDNPALVAWMRRFNAHRL